LTITIDTDTRHRNRGRRPGTPRHLSPPSPPEQGTCPNPMGTRPRVSRDTPNTGPHAEAPARAKTKTAAIRYTIAELAGGVPAKVTAWLARLRLHSVPQQETGQLRDGRHPT
jgi:hypothetical protein